MRLSDCFNVSYSKSIYNAEFKDLALTDDEVKELQSTLLSILVDFNNVCEKYDVKYMLAGGSVLGAIRHRGFIPWDDDIDIHITRDNYMKFVRLCMPELKNKYILAEPLSTNYYLKFPKLFLKDSILLELPLFGTPEYHMISIDLFIVDYVSNCVFVRRIKELLYTLALAASSCCVDYKFPSPLLLKRAKTNENLKKYYGLRRFVGFIFSHMGGYRFYSLICAKIAESASSNSANMSSVSGTLGYNRGAFPKELFDNIIITEFEGKMFPIPAEYDLYLRRYYGDNYMQLPPDNKREKHLVCQLKIPENY